MWQPPPHGPQDGRRPPPGQPPQWQASGPPVARRSMARSLLLALVCGFVLTTALGIAVVSAGGPMQLAARQVCAGRVEVETRDWASKKLGRAKRGTGTEVRFKCVHRGVERDITDSTVGTMLVGVGLAAVGVIVVPILIVVAINALRPRRRGQHGP